MKEYACDDKDGLVAYIYDEISPVERQIVEAHLAGCQVCAAEIASLSDVRQELVSWLPPEPELGFTITQKPATVLRPARWRSAPLPVWAQVAAAVLVVAAGAAIANVQVRYDTTGITLSTGWKPVQVNAPAASGAAGEAVAVPAAADSDWRAALVALESDMRQEMQMLRQASVPIAASGSSVGTSEAALLKRVQSLIDESEQRQRQELAVRLTQFGRDVELQRRADLVRIEQGVGQLQGRTGAEVAEQRKVLNYLMRVSGRQVLPE